MQRASAISPENSIVPNTIDMALQPSREVSTALHCTVHSSSDRPFICCMELDQLYFNLFVEIFGTTSVTSLDYTRVMDTADHSLSLPLSLFLNRPVPLSRQSHHSPSCTSMSRGQRSAACHKQRQKGDPLVTPSDCTPHRHGTAHAFMCILRLMQCYGHL